jgi:hypothetical protein
MVERGYQEGKATFFDRIMDLVPRGTKAETISPTTEEQAVEETIKVSWETGPFRLRLGEQLLEFHHDIAITDETVPVPYDWIIVDPTRYFDSFAGFFRLRPRQNQVFGRGEEIQEGTFDYPSSVSLRHVEISNVRGDLVVRPLDKEATTTIAAVAEDKEGSALSELRHRNLAELHRLLGGPIAPLSPEAALTLLEEVNRILAEEEYRERDDDGRPGGLVEIPSTLVPVFVGDIHAKIDNLLKVLISGDLLGALSRDEACLVLLGDIVHSEEDGQLEEMASSALTFDFVLRLKRQFPRNVFYTRGNHESFRPEIGKGGVAQGVLLKKHFKKTRGKDYLNAAEQFFDSLPFIVCSETYAACHGAPVRSRVSRETLRNIRRYPGLQHEIVTNRPRGPGRPTGYGKGDVKQFRRSLELPKHSPLIVAHTPLTPDDTIWMNVNDIVGHHLVFSAREPYTAAIPLRYLTEPLVGRFNAEALNP